MTPYYEDDLVTIYHGDCREWMPDDCPVVVTDPPFGIGKRPRTYQAKTGPAVAWDDVFVLPPVGSATSLFLMPGVANLVSCPEAIGDLAYRWTLACWISNGMTRSPVGYGNWIPVVVYAAPGVVIYRQRSDHGKVAVSGERPNHPSPKPLAAMSWIVDMCPPGAILDPFAGSGSTLVAARLAGRRAIGIEIEERYCEIAAQRCSQEVLGLAG